MNTTLQEILHMAGLARVQTEIEQLALPSIRIHAQAVDESQIARGASRFGGVPDLTQASAWPRLDGAPLPFVAQINCAEIVEYDPDHLLPNTGIISFFFDVDAFFDLINQDNTKTWAVIYDQSPPSLLRQVDLPYPAPVRSYRPSRLIYTPEITLPYYSFYDDTSLLRLAEPLTEQEVDAYYAVQNQLARMPETRFHFPIHRLLGHPDPVQVAMHDQLPGKPEEWQLLFQMDSDSAPDTNWGDTGRIYYWIRTVDLLQCDFSRVALILQCT